MNLPIREIAIAIESKDANKLKQLKGIGNRTAQKIIATLEGKMNKFALIRKAEQKEILPVEDVSKQVLDVLVVQLGHKATEARRMVSDAMKRNRSISTPEQLFEEIYRGAEIS